MERAEQEPRRSPLQQHLIRLAHEIRFFSTLLPAEMLPKLEQVQAILERKLIPLLAPDYPLLVAITGGGSTGKSTLFNALVGIPASTVRSRAGCTRRVLAALHPELADRPGLLDALFEQFHANARPVPLQSTAELETAGTPLYISCAQLSPRRVILDTPDFDTGSREGFTNRAASQEVLAVSDILLYLFNNQTYNNKSNTDFVREALNRVGTRKVVLLYRCSRAFSEEEVREHAGTLLANLYPSKADQESACLGIYRIDEDDNVVAGKALPVIRPLAGEPPLEERLDALDIMQTRSEVMRTMLIGILSELRVLIDRLRKEEDALLVYRDALRLQTGLTCSESLSAFPSQELMKRFSALWESEQPKWIRGCRWGARKLTAATKKVGLLARDLLFPAKAPAVPNDDRDWKGQFRLKLDENFAGLRTTILNDTLIVKGSTSDPDLKPLIERMEIAQNLEPDRFKFDLLGDTGTFQATVPRPHKLESIRAELEKEDPAELFTSLWSEAESVMPISRELDERLLQIVRQVRSEMSFKEKSREAFGAMIETLPAVLGVTFVLCTPDGGAVSGGILVQLGSLFGLTDLWALLALPAGVAVNSANRKMLQILLAPIFKAWYGERAQALTKIFEQYLTGTILKRCDDLQGETGRVLETLAPSMRFAEESVENRNKEGE